MVKVEHVLLFLVGAFLVYHMMGKCRRVEGWGYGDIVSNMLWDELKHGKLTKNDIIQDVTGFPSCKSMNPARTVAKKTYGLTGVEYSWVPCKNITTENECNISAEATGWLESTNTKNTLCKWVGGKCQPTNPARYCSS